MHNIKLQLLKMWNLFSNSIFKIVKTYNYFGTFFSIHWMWNCNDSCHITRIINCISSRMHRSHWKTANKYVFRVSLFHMIFNWKFEIIDFIRIVRSFTREFSTGTSSTIENCSRKSSSRSSKRIDNFLSGAAKRMKKYRLF